MKNLSNKMKVQFFLILLIAAEHANAANIIAGVKSLSDFVSKLGVALSVIAFIAAGIMYYLNKQIGAEKLGSAITGTVILASASGLSSLLIQMFS